MKKHILKLAACAVLSLSLFCSCDTDAEGTLYEVGKTEYAFASTFLKSELLPSDGNKIVVPVYRNTKNGSGTVSVWMEKVSENAKGVFTLENQTVTFEDGKSIAELAVSYDDINQLGTAEIYEFVLSFAGTEASPSKVNSIKVSAQRKLIFKNIGTGIFTSGLFGGGSWKVEVEKAEGTGIYRLLSVYKTGYPIVFSVDDNGEVISFKEQITGYELEGYMLSVRFVEAEKEGNTYHFTLDIITAEFGSLGKRVESIQLPE